jgi:hypothetical protein
MDGDADKEDHHGKDDVTDDAEEILSQFADALAQVSQHQAQAEDLNRNLLHVNEGLAEAILSFNELMKVTLAREEHLQAAVDRLKAIAEKLDARHIDVLNHLELRTRRFTTMLFWALLLSAFAVTGAVISVAFLLIRAG